MSSTADDPDNPDTIADISPRRDSDSLEVVDTVSVHKSVPEPAQAVTGKNFVAEKIPDDLDSTVTKTIGPDTETAVEDYSKTRASSDPFDITSSDRFAQEFPEFRKVDYDAKNMSGVSFDITPGTPIAESSPKFCQAVVKAGTESVSGGKANTGAASLAVQCASALSSQPGKKRGLQTCVVCSTTLKANAYVPETEGLKVCLECEKLESTTKVLASREFEGWGGLPLEPKKQQSRYVRKNHRTFDALSNDALSRIPIMKNGNSTTLKVK